MIKKLRSILITVILVLIIIVPSVNIFAETQDDFSADFSDPGLDNNITIPPSALAELISGGQISAAEASYLDNFFENVLIYSDVIPNDNILISVEGGQITVSVASKSYTAENGSIITWVPVSFEIGNEIVTFAEGDTYTAVFDAATSGGEYVRVHYRTEIFLPQSYVSALLNFAYADAENGNEILKNQSQSLESYMEALTKYRIYIDELERFEINAEKYEEYLAAVAVYEDEYALYLSCLSDKAIYEAALKAYNKYLADYAAYLTAIEDYKKVSKENEELVKKYHQYIKDKNVAIASLDVMESLFTSPVGGLEATGTLYQALRNAEIVQMFNKYKSVLISIYGVSEKDINDLVKGAEVLNTLLEGYAAARQESVKSAFAYYKANYTAICTKFNYLYDGMTNILSPVIFNHICGKMELEYQDEAVYKKWRLKNLVAHIYLICEGLDDSQSASTTFVFYNDNGKTHTYYFTDLLAPNLIINDTNNANPSNITWPQEIDFSNFPPIPEEPAKISKPLAPVIYAEPVKPEQINVPVKPDEVDTPGVAPKLSDTDARLIYNAAAVMAELEEGIIQKRDVDSGFMLELFTENTKIVSAAGNPVVTVYSYDGKCIISEFEYGAGDSITLPQTLNRSEDLRYEYTFSGWSLSQYDFIAPQATGITSDICIYPFYEKNDRLYLIEFDLDGRVFSTRYKYGEMPVFDGSTDKTAVKDTVFTFAGWFPSVNKVTGDMLYTAEYTESVREYLITFSDKDKTNTKSYAYGSIPVPPEGMAKSYISGISRFDFKDWNTEISHVESDIIYTAIYKETQLISLPRGSGGRTALTVKGISFTADTDGSELIIKELVNHSASVGGRIEIKLSDVTLILDSAFVALLNEKSSDGVVIKLIGDTESGITILFRTMAGLTITGLPEFRVIADLVSAAGRLVIYDGSEEIPISETYGVVSFSAANGNFYSFKRKFKVTAVTVTGGAVFVNNSMLEKGNGISLEILPEYGYKIGEIRIKNLATGEVTVVEKISAFKMPDSDISVEVVFTEIKYHITFVLNGETILSSYYNLGETPVLPTIVTVYESDGYLYEFTGWSPRVSDVMEDMIYTARFTATLVENYGDLGEGNAIETIIKTIVIPASCAFMAVVTLILGLVILRKRSKIKR